MSLQFKPYLLLLLPHSFNKKWHQNNETARKCYIIALTIIWFCPKLICSRITIWNFISLSISTIIWPVNIPCNITVTTTTGDVPFNQSDLHVLYVLRVYITNTFYSSDPKHSASTCTNFAVELTRVITVAIVIIVANISVSQWYYCQDSTQNDIKVT